MGPLLRAGTRCCPRLHGAPAAFQLGKWPDGQRRGRITGPRLDGQRGMMPSRRNAASCPAAGTGSHAEPRGGPAWALPPAAPPSPALCSPPRHRLQDPDGGNRGEEDQAAGLGHGGTGAVQNHHHGLLPRSHGHHLGLRHHGPQVLREHPELDEEHQGERLCRRRAAPHRQQVRHGEQAQGAAGRRREAGQGARDPLLRDQRQVQRERGRGLQHAGTGHPAENRPESRPGRQGLAGAGLAAQGQQQVLRGLRRSPGPVPTGQRGRLSPGRGPGRGMGVPEPVPARDFGAIKRSRLCLVPCVASLWGGGNGSGTGTAPGSGSGPAEDGRGRRAELATPPSLNHAPNANKARLASPSERRPRPSLVAPPPRCAPRLFCFSHKPSRPKMAAR